MSENLIDDLEEGEIADDVVETVIEKKEKRLPRRYDVTDDKFVPKHKKNCKHATQYHKQKSSTDNSHKNWKLHKKHHKACPKHNDRRHSKFLVKNSNSFKEESLNMGVRKKIYKFNSPKTFLGKCAFKNFMSPPRKVTKSETFNSNFPSKTFDPFPKLLSDYKKSRDEFSKYVKASNLKEDIKSPKTREKNDNVSPKQVSDNDINIIEIIQIDSDDEDEEELRRLALATCLKRQAVHQNSLEIENSCKASRSVSDLPIVSSDNYEVVDMEMGNSDSENVEVDNDLYVIDTTPSYFCDLTQTSINSSSVPNLNSGLQNDGFLPNLNIEQIPNFTNDTFCQEVNNNLYSNFDLVSENSPKPSSQLDDDFEEELLRAELLANMNSIRKKSQNDDTRKVLQEKMNPLRVENNIFKTGNEFNEMKPVNMKTDISSIFNEGQINMESKIFNNEASLKEVRSKSMNSDATRNENIFNERIISIKNEMSNNETSFKEERTVSIVSNLPKNEKTFTDRTRSVTAIFPEQNYMNVNTAKKKKVELKVKVNNVAPVNTNVLPLNKVLLPQERLVISLNNESSSDDSDQEDVLNSDSDKNSAVASLEALISNARQESDVKKDSTNNSNSSTDAVSWLSKAQQEEYNSLKKILDSKKQNPLSQSKIANPAETNELNLLKKKLLIAKKNLDKEKEIMDVTMKDLMKKKRAYMASKLKTQQLKEQLLAAERVRKSNLQLWTKCSSNLTTLKKSVSKRKGIIISLQTKINSFFPDFCSNGYSPLSDYIGDHNYNINLSSS